MASCWTNADPARQLAVTVLGSPGSSWTSAEVRRLRFPNSAEQGEPTNVFCFSEDKPVRFEAKIKASPQFGGEQAGIYAWASAASWVKLVVESGGENGTFVVFAQQQQKLVDESVDSIPRVCGKMRLPEFKGQIWLHIAVLNTGKAVAFWRCEDTDAWQPLLRGVGWKTTNELDPDETFGSLADGDPRGQKVAECVLPGEHWVAALVAEQWRVGSIDDAEYQQAVAVTFEKFRAGDAVGEVEAKSS